MILVYRPELENPPMDKECSLGFSFLGQNGAKAHVRLAAGVTRDFSEEVWEAIKDYDVVKNLLNLGALRIEKEEACVMPAAPSKPEGISSQSLPSAMALVENSFDVKQLESWDAGENRIKVKNAISRRIKAITEGNG